MTKRLQPAIYEEEIEESVMNSTVFAQTGTANALVDNTLRSFHVGGQLLRSSITHTPKIVTIFGAEND